MTWVMAILFGVITYFMVKWVLLGVFTLVLLKQYEKMIDRELQLSDLYLSYGDVPRALGHHRKAQDLLKEFARKKEEL